MNVFKFYGSLRLGDYGLSTILLSWYPKSFLKEINLLKFGKDTFQGIPIDFPIPYFPDLDQVIIEYENAEDQALLTKRSFKYVKPPRSRESIFGNEIREISLNNIDPQQLNSVIENIPNADFLATLDKLEIKVTSSSPTLSLSSLDKLLHFYQRHRNAYEHSVKKTICKVSLSVSGIEDWGLGLSNPKIIVNESERDIYSYYIRKGIDPNFLVNFLSGFRFTKNSELRKF